jgi:hypothetical protein
MARVDVQGSDLTTAFGVLFLEAEWASHQVSVFLAQEQYYNWLDASRPMQRLQTDQNRVPEQVGDGSSGLQSYVIGQLHGLWRSKGWETVHKVFHLLLSPNHIRHLLCLLKIANNLIFEVLVCVFLPAWPECNLA